MILLRLACNALNFIIVIRWWLVLQKHLEQVHPIIPWFRLWLIYYHQIMFDCFFTRYY
jgi:hypothetical protein